jgi:glutaredoxin
LKDLLKQILEAPSSTKGEKINSSRPFGDNNSKYLTADLEGTFAMDCDAMQLEKEDNYIIERKSYSKKSNEYSTTIKRGSENWVKTTSTTSTDKDTGLITEDIGNSKRGNLEYLMVSDGYVRLLVLDKSKTKLQSVLTKCSNSLTNPVITISVNSADGIVSSEANKQNNVFEIKDLKIGESLPNGNCSKKLVSMQIFEDKRLQECSFETTLLDVPYKTSVLLLDGKIASVNFTGQYFNTGKYQNISGYSSLFHEMKIPENDVKSHLDLLVTKISEKIGTAEVTKIKGSIDTQNENSYKCEESINTWATYTCNLRLKEAIKQYNKAITESCGKCEYTEYKFNWDGEYKAQLKAKVPQYKNSPGYMTEVNFKYSTSKTNTEINEYIKRKNEYTTSPSLNENYIKIINDFNEKLKNKRNNDF